MDRSAVAAMMTNAFLEDAPKLAATFDAWCDRFFAHYYAARPVNATFIGIHQHDDALPDFSATAWARQSTEMAELRAALERIPIARLDTARRHDAMLADGFLELQIMEEALPQFRRGNPALYTGEGVFSVLSLFLRDAEPFAERVASAISRMRALPEFLAQARTNVSEAPIAWTEQALREARSGAINFGDGLPRLARERQIADPCFLEAASSAQSAFDQHARWLDEDLRRRPVDEVACGRQAFDRYLARGHFLPAEHDSTWLMAYAARALEQASVALDERARQLDPARSWREQLADLEELHPSADRYYDAFPRVWNAAKDAAVAADLLTWPDYPIDYVPVPESDREAAAGLYYLPYRCPPPFGRAERHRYLVPPLNADMTEADQTRILRGMNDAAITLNHVIHHGGLGHHVQNWHAFRAASRVGQIAGVDCASRIAMFCGGTLVEGWACYATDLMDEIGFLTPLESLSQHQGRLRMAARALGDVSLHTGAWSLAETAAFYEKAAGMSATAAHGEAVKNSMYPGAAMMYLIGTDAIHDLRNDVASRLGSDFSPRAFHDHFLQFGAIPVTLIAAEMLGSA